MYLLITIIAALLVGLVLVVLVQNIFGAPEPSGVEEPVWGPGYPGGGGYGVHGVPIAHSYAHGYRSGPRFRVVRRGYDIADVERYLANLSNLEASREMPEGVPGEIQREALWVNRGQAQGEVPWGNRGQAQRETPWGEIGGEDSRDDMREDPERGRAEQ